MGIGSWKEVKMRKANGGKVESCSIIKNENRRLAPEENEAQGIVNSYLEDLYNKDTYE